ncbi:ISL3 family transposase, partial [Enterococcus faecium]
MSYTHLIKETLDILDLSVTFNENCLTKEKYKGQICHIYRGNLIYTAQECIHCKHQIAS